MPAPKDPVARALWVERIREANRLQFLDPVKRERHQVATRAAAQRPEAANNKGRFKKTRFVYWDGSNWDDGFLRKDGHFSVYRPDHPSATASGWIFRYHVVWWLKTGEVITRGTVLHHKNEIKTDDRFENLEKMSHAYHTRLHCVKPLVELKCIHCDKLFYLPKWKNYQKFCSLDCYQKYPKSDDTKARQSAGIKLAYAEGRR